MAERLESIAKVLTPNDVGATGTHQAGIVVPKSGPMLSFFPRLDVQLSNPRAILHGLDLVTDEDIPLRFIYYNGKIHGTSTRNEYRLTGLTAFLKAHMAAPGDELRLDHIRSGRIGLAVIKHDRAERPSEEPNRIALTGSWSTYRRKRA